MQPSGDEILRRKLLRMTCRGIHRGALKAVTRLSHPERSRGTFTNTLSAKYTSTRQEPLFSLTPNPLPLGEGELNSPGRHERRKVRGPAGVAPLVVVPADDLHHLVVDG